MSLRLRSVFIDDSTDYEAYNNFVQVKI